MRCNTVYCGSFCVLFNEINLAYPHRPDTIICNVSFGRFLTILNNSVTIP